MSDRRSIIITGVSSFIGVHLVRHFQGLGYATTCTISQDKTNYDQLRRERIQAALDAGASVERLDITSKTGLKQFIQEYEPDYWIHHAGWASQYGSLEFDLTKAHGVNVAPLEVLYSELKAVGCKGVIVTGSSAEYSDSDFACKESDMCAPAMPYGLSKLSETLRAGQLSTEYDLPTRVIRVFIPYGILDAPQKLLPSVITALSNGENVALSPCTQRRDFVYIDDLVAGYEASVKDLGRPGNFDIFNLCSGESTALKEFLLEVADIMQADPVLMGFGARAMRAGESPVSFGSREKAERVLNWKPRSLQEGIAAYLSDLDVAT